MGTVCKLCVIIYVNKCQVPMFHTSCQASRKHCTPSLPACSRTGCLSPLGAKHQAWRQSERLDRSQPSDPREVVRFQASGKEQGKQTLQPQSLPSIALPGGSLLLQGKEAQGCICHMGLACRGYRGHPGGWGGSAGQRRLPGRPCVSPDIVLCF